jgi:cytochrome subunit of sulfide dehydrogenase
MTHMIAKLAMAASLATVLQPVHAQNQRGAQLAATCANCHGTNGQARGEMKPLAGMSAEKLLAAVNDYRNGNQPATIMHQIAKGYTEEQLKLIAAFFAAQPATR